MTKKVEKPWGNYQTLFIEDGYQVKRIEVNPGHRLSYQMHSKRAEKWTIVTGRGKVTLDGKEIVVAAGSVVQIPVESKHRIENNGKTQLIFIEIQLGNYLGEDDIVRLEDDYNRKSESEPSSAPRPRK